MTRHNDLRGAGPWSFQPTTDLAPGETFHLDFRNREKGKFKEFLPLDTYQVQNSSAQMAQLELNNKYADAIAPNSVESDDRQAFSYLSVTNIGGSAIPKEDLRITVKKNPTGADEQSRKEMSGSWPERALNDLIPGGIPNGE